jgi:hypothetical protein
MPTSYMDYGKSFNWQSHLLFLNGILEKLRFRNWSNNLYLHQQVGTVMMLFTRQNLEKAQLIEYNNATSILESNYNASLDTKLIIHGFGSSCHRVWAREMRLSFLAVVSSSKKDFVFCVMSFIAMVNSSKKDFVYCFYKARE